MSRLSQPALFFLALGPFATLKPEPGAILSLFKSALLLLAFGPFTAHKTKLSPVPLLIYPACFAEPFSDFRQEILSKFVCVRNDRVP